MAAIQCPGCGLPVEVADGATCPRCGARLVVSQLTPPEPLAPTSLPAPWNHEATLLDPVPAASRPPATGEVAYTSTGLAYEPTAVPAPGMASLPEGAARVLLPRYGPPAQPGEDAAPPGGAPNAPPDAPPDGQPPKQGQKGARARWIAGLLIGLLIFGSAAGALRAGMLGHTSTHARATPTPTPLPSPTPTVPPVSYTAALTAKTSGWPVSASSFFRADGYHLTSGIIVPAPAPALSNFDVSVQVRQVKGVTSASYGLAFTRGNPQDTYEFVAAANGTAAVYLVSSDSRTALVTPAHSAAIALGLRKTNTLEVQGSNDLLTFLINGQVIAQVSDGAGGPGAVGLMGAPKAEVVFTDFTLTGTS